MIDFLNINDLDPPMGDFSSRRTLSEVRSLWVKPLPGEDGAPLTRIIHTRLFLPHEPVKIERMGYRSAQGYHKCGSRQDNDWITDLRILSFENGEWREIQYFRNLEKPNDASFTWISLDGITTSGLSLEIRRSGIDGWWTPWNLAAGAFTVEGPAAPVPAPRCEYTLASAEGPSGSKEGTAEFGNSWIKTRYFLNRPACSFFSIGPENKKSKNLLDIRPGNINQGVILRETGKGPLADPHTRFRFRGKSSPGSRGIIYDISEDTGRITYRVEWQLSDHRLVLKAVRENTVPVTASESALWRFTLDPAVSPVHAAGNLVQTGQTGLMKPPLLLVIPGYGALKTEASDGIMFRSETDRPGGRIMWEIKLFEEPGERGDWIIPAGRREGEVTFAPYTADIPLDDETPDDVRSAVRNVFPVALTFRADTGTLSNNGASIHCPISMDTWASHTLRSGELFPGFPASELLRFSLERWLTGGPGYAAGNLIQDGRIHDAEDEYLMTGTAAFTGLAEYMKAGSPEWTARFAGEIRSRFTALKERDLDGDGLIESPYRTGTSGSGQWSTCWYDVISYGWKDALTNAILYEGLLSFLAAVNAEGSPLSDLIPRVDQWLENLKANYRETFYNHDTGWLAGWRCREDKLHDYAFLAANGAASASGVIDPEDSRRFLGNLLKEAERAGMPDPVLGLPGNLRPIPDRDLSDIMQGFPFGYYQNGGRTQSMARHFVRGLNAAGYKKEAEELLIKLCRGLTAGLCFGGTGSGVDWRYWDGRPSGYEGLLTDQFGVIGTALEMYGLYSQY
ncbi:MAG: hypothetical protein ACLFSE_08020 [Spirochaetia bacterium]